MLGRRSRFELAAALAVYLVAAVGLFGQPFAHPGRHECLCGSSTDAGTYVWAFAWFPHALIRGLNPFYTHLLFAPQGINLAHGSLVPIAALLLSPVTAIAGPLFSFNLAMLLSPVLAAWFTFLLCRRITGMFLPSLVGGWLFGFSTYLIAQLTSHLNLVLVFPVPAIVLLVLRAVDGEVGRVRFALWLALLLLLQVGFSLEVLVTFTLFGGFALGLGYALAEPPVRGALRECLVPIGLGYLAALAVASPYLYYALKPGGLPVLTWRSDKFSADLFAYVIPNTYTQLGGSSFSSLTSRFTAYAVEGSAYLGIPLIAMMLLGAVAGWGRRGVRVLVLVLVVVLVCSLGGRLNAGGPTDVPLPWALVHGLPGLGLILPGRMVMYVFLIGALLSALWLAQRRGWWRWLLAAAAIAFLWPAIGGNFWRSIPEQPAFFRAEVYRKDIQPPDTVLVLPVGIAGQSMLWHAEAHLGFTMASGYVTAPEAPDPYKRFAIYPMLTYFTRVPHATAAAATFLRAEHITVVVLDPAAAATSPWVPTLTGLGWEPSVRDGVVVLRQARNPAAALRNDGARRPGFEAGGYVTRACRAGTASQAVCAGAR